MYFKLFDKWTSLELERVRLLATLHLKMMMGKERSSVPEDCQSGDILKEGNVKEERKEERAGNRIGIIFSHVWTFEKERRQIGEVILKASRVYGPVRLCALLSLCTEDLNPNIGEERKDYILGKNINTHMPSALVRFLQINRINKMYPIG